MGLRRQAVQGVFWTGLSLGSRSILQLLVTAVLARLLLPEEFGLLALPLLLINFLLIFRGAGLAAAFAQRKEITKAHADAVFWYTAASGVAIAALVLALAPLAGWLLGEPRVVPVMRWASLTVLIDSLAAAPVALLTRELRFKRIAARELLGDLLGAGIGIGMALNGFGVYSLVGQTVGGAAFGAVFVWMASGFRPGLRFSRAALRDLLGFGAHVTGFQVFGYVNKNLDRLLLGRFASATTLAFYDRGAQALRLPLQVIHNVVGRVLFPAMSRIEDADAARKAYLDSIRVLCGALYLPLAAGVALAPTAVAVLFGPQWGPSAFVLACFALAGLPQAVMTTQGWIYRSRGRPDLQLRTALIYAPVAIGAIVVGLQWGLRGVTLAYLAGSYGAISLWFTAHRLIGLRWSHLGRALRGILLAAAVAGAWMWATDAGLALLGVASPFLRLPIALAVGGGAYLLVLRLADRPLLQEARALLGHLRASPQPEPGDAGPVTPP